LKYMFGGDATLPMTITTAGGGGLSAAAQHSQSLEALLCHIPGLKVVMPSNPCVRQLRGVHPLIIGPRYVRVYPCVAKKNRACVDLTLYGLATHVRHTAPCICRYVRAGMYARTSPSAAPATPPRVAPLRYRPLRLAGGPLGLLPTQKRPTASCLSGSPSSQLCSPHLRSENPGKVRSCPLGQPSMFPCAFFTSITLPTPVAKLGNLRGPSPRARAATSGPTGFLDGSCRRHVQRFSTLLRSC
jgi:hypothetical protein